MSKSDDKIIFNYLTSPSLSDVDVYPLNDRIHYIHLINHTYEEIDGDLGPLLMNNNHNETYRLFETKSAISSLLANLIEILFSNFIHNDTFLCELMEQYSQIFHQYYAHFIPFIFQNFNTLFNIPSDKCLDSSFNMLAMIFQIACCQQHDQQCLFCIEFLNKKNTNSNTQNCTLLFDDEIQRVRIHYVNLERFLNSRKSSAVYTSTNMASYF